MTTFFAAVFACDWYPEVICLLGTAFALTVSYYQCDEAREIIRRRAAAIEERKLYLETLLATPDNDSMPSNDISADEVNR